MSAKITLPATLSSAEDIQEAIDELRVLGRHASVFTRQSLSDPLRELFDAGQLSDATAVKEMIVWLEKVIATAPRIGITLAGPLGPSNKETITAWFRTNIAPDVVVGFSHNKSLLGGALVRIGSHIYDWSYRSRLLDSPVNFTKVLNNV